MNFQDQLMQEMNRLDTRGGNGDFEKTVYPNQTLKHEQLFFNGDNTEYLVRILPPKDENSFFAVGFQEFYMQVTNKKGTSMDGFITLPLQLDPENNEFHSKVLNWMENDAMPNAYPSSGLNKRYYLNVVRLEPQGRGQYLHEVDENGQIVVRVLKVPQTAYKELLKDLADPNTVPPEGADDGFGMLSAQNAYPFRIWRTGKGLETEYSTSVYEHDLGPLPQGWEEQLEDLNYLATPDDVFNEDFTYYKAAVHEGKEDEYNANRNNNGGGEEATQAPQQQQPTSGFTGGQFANTTQVTDEDMSHLPPKQETPQGNGNGFGAPQQNGGNFNQPQQQPAQTQQAPQQNAGNFGNFNQPTQQQAPQPNPAPQEEPAPTPAPQQQAEPQQAPQQNTGGGGVPDVDDLLAQVQNEVNKG